MPLPAKAHTKRKNPFPFNDLPDRVRHKIQTRGAKDRACWIWTGTIQPARSRARPSRYDDRKHETFENRHSFGAEPPLPLVWDSRAGKKVAAHRFIRSLLTCTPVTAVPKLDRCRDDCRCVSPWHNVELDPPTLPSTAAPVEVRAGASVDVLAVLKENRPATGFSEADFPQIEEDCGLPAGSITAPVWAEYVAWDEENSDDDD